MAPSDAPARRRPAESVRRVLFRIVAPVQRFLRTEAASGVLLMAAATLALAWANSPQARVYFSLADVPLGLRAGAHDVSMALRRWINDVGMSLFFLVAGMEIRRELSTGELRTPARVALPLLAALGGMLAPAGLYLLVARGAAAPGWGIPMATDVAFSLGVLGFVRRRVPPSLLVFLTALAIFDDLGAIVVIALFYGGRVAALPLAISLTLAALLVTLSRRRVQSVLPYGAVGVALWFALHHAGMHPTLAGVAVGLALPPAPLRETSAVLDDLDGALDQLRRRGDHAGRDVLGAIERHLEAMQSPLDRVMHGMHGVVAFGVVPLFALVNAGVAVDLSRAAAAPATLGAALGLLIGKPLGITAATWLGVRAGLAPLPTGARWRDIVGVAMVAGIGFTMSLFVDELAFHGNRALEEAARVGVLGGSVASAVAGILWIRATGRLAAAPADDDEGESVYVGAARFADAFRVQGWAWPAALDGQTLAAVGLRARFGVTVLGRTQTSAAATSRLVLVPPDEPIPAGTELIVVGAGEQLDAMVHTLSGPTEAVPP